MACKHKFILIEQRTRGPQVQQDNLNSTAPHAEIVPGQWRDEYGARAGCIECGEIRTVWSNGDIETEIKVNDRQ